MGLIGFCLGVGEAVSPAFAGKRAVQRHQLVYATLGAAVGQEIHALALQVFTPEEYADVSRG